MTSQKQPLSISELKVLETKPKTLANKILNWIVCLLPLILAVIILLNYKLVPNHFLAVPALYLYPPSNIYAWFIGVIAAGFAIWSIFSIFFKRAYEKLRHGAPIYTAILVFFLLYDILTLKTAVLELPFFPWIDAIMSAIVADRDILLKATANSVLLLFIGYFSGAAIGIIMGILAGNIKRVRYWVTPLVKFLGTIPATTYIPILVVLPISFFVDRILLIAIGVWYPVAMTTLNGVLNVPKSHFEAAKTFGANKAQLILKVSVPAALPFIFQGLVQGMAIACTLLLIAEGLGVEAGIGLYLNSASATVSFANIFAALVVLCSIFFAVNAILNAIKKRVLRWQEDKTNER